MHTSIFSHKHLFYASWITSHNYCLSLPHKLYLLIVNTYNGVDVCVCDCVDVFVELESPVIAGVTFVQEACKTRKNVLDQVLTFCLNILYTPEASRSPRLTDGALHTSGSIATVLLRVR